MRLKSTFDHGDVPKPRLGAQPRDTILLMISRVVFSYGNSIAYNDLSCKWISGAHDILLNTCSCHVSSSGVRITVGCSG
jgi:hypothetical protein